MTFIRIAFVKEAKFALYANKKVADRYILDRTLPETVDIKVFKLPLIEANNFDINSTWKDVSEKWKKLQWGTCYCNGTAKEKCTIQSQTTN